MSEHKTTPKREARGDPSGWGGTCGYCGFGGMRPSQVSCGRCGLWSGTEYEVRQPVQQTTREERLEARLRALLRLLDLVPWCDQAGLRLGPGVPHYDAARQEVPNVSE